ncbi:hypothetical protein QJS10_CPB11g01811 [Acorus calamus]|uniref:Tify domain-containing protein n=1 Tax=Acorus calamus TaxID=4465 RepID=A0AAV9DWJ5_ACOCL|nr:hypothetical protein QJS10_CPB11g01811 [Acorus calamus]
MGSKYDSDSDLCVLRLGPAATEAAAEEFQRRQQNNNHHHHQNQELSIFYGGRVCVCDVTEIQAMEIINAAKRRRRRRRG